ncbi:MAG TPA: sulfotransferase [Steroidobacteraceae bacterium]|nr:sulfotransferase [Steroidobacteraceae bacterium]
MGLDVIGAGLGRTGTSSLKLALERLGFGPCHHMTELIAHPGTALSWERAADGDAVDWDELLGGYRATTDWPACTFYRELAAYYPSAKLILTRRDAEGWFRSTQATIFSDAHLGATERRPHGAFVRKAIVGSFAGRIHDREHLIAAYERHNAEVLRAIPRARLLVYDVREGWAPLCRFLGVPAPQEPFPCANTTEDFRQRRAISSPR